MRQILILALLFSAAFAHLGEEVTGQEAHSPLEILLDNPAAIITALVIFACLSYVFYTLFPMKKRYRKTFFMIVGAVAVIFLGLVYLSLTKEPAAPKPYHAHADFKVILDGVPFDFAQAKYMSVPNKTLNQRVHLHDMDGAVIHHHARNVTLSDFFRSLNMTFNSTCFVTDVNASYCNGERTLRMFVMHYGGSWKQNTEMEKYVFQDLDRILITYGDPAIPPSDQFPLVTDRACIQSERCPERGKPSDESTCAGDVCLA